MSTDSRIGGYRIGRELGKGGFASVRQGMHEDGSAVAIKVIERGSLNPDDQIRREIRLCKALRHPNIVPYVTHFVTESNVYIVQELVEGGELYDQLEAAGRFDQPRARKCFAQLVEGVEYCHRAGVCHRDLKLENVLVAADGTVKITDFGFSKQFTNGSPKTVVGTALYVAPEVVLRDGMEYNGEASDVWSLGIILYLLTAGRFPFNRGHIGGVAPGMTLRSKEKFRNDNFRVPSHFSEDLTSLLRGILCADPTRRLTIADIRAHRWFRAGEATTRRDHPATPPSPPEHAEEPVEWTVISVASDVGEEVAQLDFDSTDDEEEEWDVEFRSLVI
jgi:serine/threonine protein kinase